MRRGLSSVVKKLLALLLVFCVVRAAIFMGADKAAHTAALAAARSDEAVSRLLDLGFGAAAPKRELDITLTTLLSESPLLRTALRADEPEEPEEPLYYIPPAESPSPAAPVETPTPAPDVVETTITGKSGYEGADGIYLRNETDYAIDIASMLAEPLSLALDVSEPQVLIIHTHGSEAFEQSDGLIYEETDPWRTEDKKFNVIRLGDELAGKLEERGIASLHDRELYDYPTYAGSYGRAEEAIRKHLSDNPDIRIVIDLHRDALVADDGTVYKTIAEVDGKKCAQVMIISGSNYSGLEHPKWRENLKLALRLQAAMNEKYPTLARPVTISQYRYNQHLTTGSLIIEVGCNGNTLTETLDAAGYFAEAAADVLLGLSDG